MIGRVIDLDCHRVGRAPGVHGTEWQRNQDTDREEHAVAELATLRLLLLQALLAGLQALLRAPIVFLSHFR